MAAAGRTIGKAIEDAAAIIKESAPVHTSRNAVDLSLAAASQATEAAAELLRYTREGPLLTTQFDGEPIEQLLDAAKMAMEIEGLNTPEQTQIYGAIVRFLEG